MPTGGEAAELCIRKVLRSADVRRNVGAVTEQAHRHEIEEPRGSDALSEALQLQEVVRRRSTETGKRRGKRRKGAVVDLEARTITKSGRRRWLMVLLLVESIIAVIAVGVLIAYLLLEGDTLQ